MIGAASMPYAVGPEFELLTGVSPDSKALVEAHVALLERLFFPGPGAAGEPRRRSASSRR
jgi:hypothetical protein